MTSNFEKDCQRLIEIFNKTQSGDTQLIRQAEQELSQIETKDGFVPFLLNFLSQANIKEDNSNEHKPHFAASIRLKNLIKYRWKKNLSDNDKELIRNGIFEQCIKQKNGNIRRQLYTTITFLIEEDYPEKWQDLLSNIAKCIQTNNPYMILGGLKILLSVYKKYHFVNRQRSDNPIEKMIDDTWPTLANILNVSLDLYNNKLQQQHGKLNHELNILLEILKIIFRIFFVSVFMNFPKHLRDTGIFEQWLNLFIKFFQIKPPKDLQLPKSNKEMLTIDSLYSIKQYSKYYNNPYVKARKWAVRCITRMLQLYGRPQYVVHPQLKPFAKLFMDKYARRFMEQFYFGIIRQHIGDQFVYFKTLAPAITYLNLCIHYGHLFQLLLENNAKYLDNIMFTCMFRIVRLTAKDLSQWQDDPNGFVENSFRFGIGSMDETYDPRSCALKFIQDTVRIRSSYTFEKLLQFSQKMIQDSHQLQIQQKKQQQQMKEPDSKYLDMMVNKDAVLCILGQLANILRKAENGKYVQALKDLIMQHVVPDFQSPFGFLRARACWLVGKYWKLNFEANEWKMIGMSVIKSLHDNELPVQMEASAGLSKIVLEKSGNLLNFIKPQIPAILGRYLEIMNDIGTEAVVQTFDTLIDRLDQGIIPFATDLLKKMLEMFAQFHIGIEKYIKEHPEEYENFQLPSGKVANKTDIVQQNNDHNNNKNHNDDRSKMQRSEEQQKEQLKTFDDCLASAMQCLKAVHTILFSSTALPELLAKLEEIMKPLINRCFTDEYLYFQFYKEEILDFIHLFSFYMNPLSIYCWQIFPKILEGYCVNIWSDQFNRCMQCAVNYIKAAHKNQLPFENFINQNFMDVVLTFAETAIHDDNINILMFTSLFENLLCCFRNIKYVNMDAYIPRILEMAMNKYTESQQLPSTQHAMLAIVSLVIYNNPTLFIKLLEQNKTTSTVLNILMNHYQELMWPQQKALVFGLSSLLLIHKNEIPQSLGQAYPQIIDVTAKTVIYMNWEEDEESEEDEEEDDEHHLEQDNDDDDEDDNNTQTNGHGHNGHHANHNGNDDIVDDGDEEDDDEKGENMDDDEEDDDNDSFAADRLIDVAANADYVDSADMKYMQQCCEMEDNPEWMMTLLDDWEDNSQIVPRSLLDEENEVIYFYQCLGKFAEIFPGIVQDWKSKLEPTNNDLLEKYLKDSQENMEDYQKRKILHEKEKADRQQMAIKAIDAAKQMANNNNHNNGNNHHR